MVADSLGGGVKSERVSRQSRAKLSFLRAPKTIFALQL
jgi:hypothetical protein